MSTIKNVLVCVIDRANGKEVDSFECKVEFYGSTPRQIETEEIFYMEHRCHDRYSEMLKYQPNRRKKINGIDYYIDAVIID